MSEDPRQYLNDNEEGTRLAQDGHQSRIWTAMPAIVQSFNLSTMTCVCQIAIQGRYEDQDGNVNFVNIGVIQDVPIVFPSAGGFTITFPVAAGDEVLVIFASRCIDSWWQNGGVQNKPMEYRMHDLSDGFAIPGPKSQPKKITGILSSGLQIRSDDLSVFIALTNDGKVSIRASEVDIVGNVKVTGTVTATGEVTGNSIPLSTHVHGGVTPGGGNTGVPHT